MKVRVNETSDSLKHYYSRVKRIALLDADEEKELSLQIQSGDERALSRLIEANLRLVIKIARNYINNDIPLIDLIQEGNMGLIKAAERFDYRKNVRFSTYAAWWIRQAITRSLANSRRTIRLPHRKEELLRRVYNSYNQLAQVLSREPNNAEIADELGIEIETVREALEYGSGMIPLEASCDDENSTSVIDVFEDDSYRPDTELMKKNDRESVISLLEQLLERERLVLMYRFDFFGKEKQTLKYIGQNLGISAETVRQIEKRAIKKLRTGNMDTMERLGI